MNAGYIVLIIVGVIGLIVGYVLFMKHSAIKGLIKSNMKAYFRARKKEFSHEEALQWMVYSRYRFEKEKREYMYDTFLSEKDKVIDEFLSAETIDNEEERELKALILFIFLFESNPVFAAHNGEKMLDTLNDIYPKMHGSYLS